MNDKDKNEVTLIQCFPTKRCAPDDHDWPTDLPGQITDNATCKKCGYSFLAYIHMDCP